MVFQMKIMFVCAPGGGGVSGWAEMPGTVSECRSCQSDDSG